MPSSRETPNMPDQSKKVLRHDQLDEIVSRLKSEGKKIVFTNGCFEVLHVGHTRYLKQAKDQGDILIIGLNTDDSVKLNKGPTRPIVPEDERAEILAALQCVDYITLFSEETPYELVKRILPDILVKGGDWTVDKIVGNDIVDKNGGQVISLPFQPGRSSTDIIDKIKKL